MRLADAFAKRLANHLLMLSLHFVHDNFCRVHHQLRNRGAGEALA